MGDHLFIVFPADMNQALGACCAFAGQSKLTLVL